MSANLGITSVFGQKSVKPHSGTAIHSGTTSSAKGRTASQSSVTAALMMLTDVLAVLAALYLALHFDFGQPRGNWGSLQQTLAGGPAVLVEFVYLGWFIAGLLILSRHDGLYGRLQTQSILHEQRRTVQACLNAGLLLCGAMYMTHNSTIPRGVVVSLIVFTTLLLCILRGLWRHSAHRDYERGMGTKNVLILGSNHVGDAVRKQLVRHRRLGRIFKGFVGLPDDPASNIQNDPAAQNAPAQIIGNLFQLRHLVRQHFIDEIIIAESCSTAQVVELVELARDLDVEILALPGVHEEVSPEAPIFYLGDFPVIAIHRRNDKAVACLLKRFLDSTLSILLLLMLAPLFAVLAAVVKLTSPGPVFYVSDRIGKKGRVFKLWKFRTMVSGADRLKASLASANERDGILFKIKNDPRITPAGRFLRKFSLDELPQLFNVLWGDMSLVGPRPPLATEVARYELKHYRRLEVLPGLTGLWQVRARHDPSFDQYVALDIAYVENWNLWMDMKILVRTAEVVLRGTGS
jgi:exopolysaccharide biosynthesis polyprenyl glycosylphosphotransferase